MINKLTKEAVIEKLTGINSRAIFIGLTIVVNHWPKLQAVRILSVTDADTLKHMFPAFEIKQDKYRKRYAELMLYYE